MARSRGLLAFTLGHNIFGPPSMSGEYNSEGKALLAHELIHVAQAGQMRDARPNVSELPAGIHRRAIENQANRLAVQALKAENTVCSRETLHSAPAGAVLGQDPVEHAEVRQEVGKQAEASQGGDSLSKFSVEVGEDFIANWTIENNSALLAITDDDQAFIIPGQGLLRVPPFSLRTHGLGPGTITRDAGPFMEVPATGASGSRLFRAGSRAILMLDAGGSRSGLPSAVYLDQLTGAVSRLGGGTVRRVDLLHKHGDHFNRLPDVVAAAGVSPHKVVAPRSFVEGGANADWDKMIRDMRAIHGAEWNPTAASLRTVSSDLVTGRFRYGDLEIRHVALRGPLTSLGRKADRGSLMSRVTRVTDGITMVVLGDLRGGDLNILYEKMEANRRGSWNEFFRGATTVSGFSHHAGRLEKGDVQGMMRLLDATLLKTGSLEITVQTNTREHAQTRSDTLELLRRLGVRVSYADMPTRGTPPSGVSVSGTSTRATGTAARTPSIIESNLSRGFARLNGLDLARQTYLRWRPLVEAHGPKAVERYERELREIETSMETLRQRLRAAAEAAMRVRAEGTTTTGGGRDYAGGTRGQQFQSALGRIPETTPAEQRFGPSGFQDLRKLREIPIEEVPLRVALHRALAHGEYSDKAFRYMLSQIEPSRQSELLTGKRGGWSPREVQFQRIRAEFAFRQRILPSGVSMAGIGGAKGKMFRGAGWLLFLTEAANLAIEAKEAYKIGQATSRNRNVVPFLRRVMFWEEIGVTPRVEAVDEHFVSNTIISDPQTISEGLTSDRWDYLYIPHSDDAPAFSDSQIIALGARLTHMVRNYDEFATLFDDSGQDAVRWRNTSAGGWDEAKWEVHVGEFDEEGFNHINSSWVELPKLTETMQAFVRRIIANTKEILELHGRGKAPEATDPESAIGGLTIAKDRIVGAARLTDEKAARTHVEVENEVPLGASGRSRTPHEIEWWSPPRFYVYKEGGGEALVGGADYNTYAVLRSLTRERYTLNIGGFYGRTWTKMRVEGNEGGKVWIDAALLNIASR